MKSTRREALKALLAGTVMAPQLAKAAPAHEGGGCRTAPKWGSGIEGQRKADLGNGKFQNPIISGDHPDPTILKDGDDYYMTFSSFYSCPGAIIWHSWDLVNWSPIGPALTVPIGSVWAMDLVKHQGRYFIYIPASPNGNASVFVIWADDIKGPWSAPIDLKLPGAIDPGHVVGEDNKRYLFVGGVKRVRLTDDGLATDGSLEKVYEPWHYPADWVVEMFAPEGPKLFRRGDWFYLVTAVGGTSGPPTSHMVVAARSRSIHGPWEDCPHNPIIRTRSAEEMWWSRGHATPFEGPGGDWWMVYHAYENGFRTLGRQALLEPIEWTKDGWFVAKGGDLSTPLAMPRKGKSGALSGLAISGFAMSGEFTAEKFGVQWSFHAPGPDEMKRVRFERNGLAVAGKGTSPANCSPLTLIAGDRSYEAQVSIDIMEAAQGGILLYYSERMFVGIGFTAGQMLTFNYGEEQRWMRADMRAATVHLKLKNENNIVTYAYSNDGMSWTQHPWQMEVSGMHHNVFGGFLSLKLALYSAGDGTVRMRDFRYRALGV